MNSLSKITTASVLKDAYNDSLVAKRLISIVTDTGLRKDLKGLLGCPTDKLAEYVMAHLLGSKVTDSNGSDFIKGKKLSEGKFATIAEVNNKHKRTLKDGTATCYYSVSKSAVISNLDTKNVDLHILVCDPFDLNNYFKLFSIPRDIWKSKWKRNQAKLTFSKKSNVWYLDYLVKTWSVK